MTRTILTCAALLICLGLDAQAYPIPPQTLRQLLEHADLVVVAQVVELREPGPGSEEGEDVPGAAGLQVQRVLVGAAPRADVLLVSWNPGMVCPAPADYRLGETVLAFLAAPAEGETLYRTCALSYGAKTLSLQALQTYQARIAEYQELRAKPAGPDRTRALTSWIVRCAVAPATRWEGVRDLTRTGANAGLPWKKGPKLTSSDQQALAQGFGQAPVLDSPTVELGELVAGWAPEVVLARLRRSIGALRKGKVESWEVEERLSLVARIMDWDEGRRLADAFDGERPWKAQLGRFLTAWQAEEDRRAGR